MKIKYLTVYDYGSGGVWRYICAHSQQEILAKYPGLQVLERDPEWFTDDDRRTILTHDIDDEPDAFLTKVMQAG